MSDIAGSRLVETDRGGRRRAQQSSWLKDKFGLSLQIVPRVLTRLLEDPDKSRNVMKAVLQMKKIDIRKFNVRISDPEI